MKLSEQDLEKIAGVTLQHYDQNAEDFWQSTRSHDVSQNIAALLQHIAGIRGGGIPSLVPAFRHNEPTYFNAT